MRTTINAGQQLGAKAWQQQAQPSLTQPDQFVHTGRGEFVFVIEYICGVPSPHLTSVLSRLNICSIIIPVVRVTCYKYRRAARRMEDGKSPSSSAWRVRMEGVTGKGNILPSYPLHSYPIYHHQL